MRAVTLALKTTSSTIAMPASATIPVVKASRSPRKPNERGMKPSRARKLERRGKSAKLVLAASARSSAVATWIRIRNQPSPITWRVSSDSTVWPPWGRE